MSSELAKKIDVALAEVAAAETSLGTLLSELSAGARAEKVTITATVQDAFARLRHAREELARLREVVEKLP